MRCSMFVSMTAFAMTLVSCTTTTQYVVLTDVPASPSFTVIPASMSKEDISAANLTTAAIVGCAVTVLERPVMLKERSDFEGEGNSSGIGAAGGQLAVAVGSDRQKGAVATTVDPTSLVAQTKADYVFIVQSQGNKPWARLLRRETSQIIFAGYLVAPEASAPGSDADPDPGVAATISMRKILTSAGIIK